MSRLEEIKNEYAQKDGRFLSWNNLKNVVGLKVLQQYENEVMQIYAKECSAASLEKASEKTSLIDNETSYVKQSEINTEENIVLL